MTRNLINFVIPLYLTYELSKSVRVSRKTMRKKNKKLDSNIFAYDTNKTLFESLNIANFSASSFA